MSPHIDIDLLRSLATERDFGRFFELAASAAAAVVDADGAALMQYTDTGLLEYRFFHGLPDDYRSLAAGFTFPAHQGTAGVALARGEPVFNPDYPNSAGAMPAFADAGLRANLAVPIGPPSDRRGVLAVSWFEADVRAPGEAESSVLLLLADLIYGAMYRQSLEAHLAQQAHFDSLTGLPNRRHLFESAAAATARCGGSGVVFVVLDLNGFKAVNDRHGHGAGDQVLVQLARRLPDAIRRGDLAARLGGDEFALVLRDITDRAVLVQLLDRLCTTLERRYLLDGGISVACPPSIGAAQSDGRDVESLLRCADQAMYEAKAQCSGDRGGWEIHDAGDVNGAAHRIANLPGSVQAHFQPVLDMQRGCVTRLEALARLRRGDRLVPPLEFLPDLDTGQKRRLFDEVLEQALDGARRWPIAGNTRLGVSVNVEPETLADPGFAAAVARMVVAAGLDPGLLTLEILERGEFLSHDVARRQLASLREIGVRLAIDDLGSAYSSLLRLRSLPIDEIKMDQTFIRDLASNLQDIAFVQSIQALAGLLRVRLVVEGAESDDVVQILDILGVVEVQGYGISRPLPAAEVEATVRRLSRWSLPAPRNVAAITYARQQSVESHVLGLLRLAPERLNSDVFSRGAMLEKLEDGLREVPDAWHLHERQMALLHDIVGNRARDLRKLIRLYRELGARLRDRLAHEVSTRRQAS